MSECTVLTLNEKLENEELHLVDVREYAEFAGGRIEGAKLLPLGELEKRHTELDHSKPIYVMCRTGNRSGQAQQKLKNLGFKNVINVSGGFEAWKKEDLPFEKDENAPWALERQVRFVAGMLVLIGFLLSFIHPYFIGISVFIGAGLTFSAVTDTCTMGMILAKMPWNKMPQTCETETSAVR
jgi:rhodanese-related sulfurtransferase